MKKIKYLRIVLWFGAFIMMGIIVYSLLHDKYSDRLYPAPPELTGGTYIQPSIAIPSIAMESTNGAWTSDDFKNQWSLVFFGFTHCPDICPASMGLLSYSMPMIKERIDEAQSDRLQGMLVSVDPYRDTPTVLEDFLSFYDAEFVGLTGQPEAIDTLTEKLGVFYRYPEGTATTTYPVDHSGSLIIVNPEGRYQAVITEMNNGETFAKDVAQVINYWTSIQ